MVLLSASPGGPVHGEQNANLQRVESEPRSPARQCHVAHRTRDGVSEGAAYLRPQSARTPPSPRGASRPRPVHVAAGPIGKALDRLLGQRLRLPVGLCCATPRHRACASIMLGRTLREPPRAALDCDASPPRAGAEAAGPTTRSSHPPASSYASSRPCCNNVGPRVHPDVIAGNAERIAAQRSTAAAHARARIATSRPGASSRPGKLGTRWTSPANSVRLVQSGLLQQASRTAPRRTHVRETSRSAAQRSRPTARPCGASPPRPTARTLRTGWGNAPPPHRPAPPALLQAGNDAFRRIARPPPPTPRDRLGLATKR